MALQFGRPQAAQDNSATPKGTAKFAAEASAAKAKALASSTAIDAPAASIRVLPSAKNPVAEAQAKLEHALSAPEKATEKQKTGGICAFATKLFTATACAFTAVTGILIGIGCVALGTALFLFPFTAGLSLAISVIAVASIGLTLYVQSGKSNTSPANSTPTAADLVEPLASGRLIAAGVA